MSPSFTVGTLTLHTTRTLPFYIFCPTLSVGQFLTEQKGFIFWYTNLMENDRQRGIINRVILGLVVFLVVGLLLFPKGAHRTVVEESSGMSTTSSSVATTSVRTTTVATTTATTTKLVSVEGTFIGVVDGTESVSQRTFKYALIDDGTEILRIDVRPLLNYDVRDIPAKLGLTNGEQVIAVGFMQKGSFVVQSITPRS